MLVQNQAKPDINILKFSINFEHEKQVFDWLNVQLYKHYDMIDTLWR